MRIQHDTDFSTVFFDRGRTLRRATWWMSTKRPFVQQKDYMRAHALLAGVPVHATSLRVSSSGQIQATCPAILLQIEQHFQ
jgi:hypothetical protein